MEINFWRIRELFRSIKNVFYYFQIIWEDRDWDHVYMERLMLAKLEKWYKRYSDVESLPLQYVGIEKDLQAMRICINILKRRKDDWYANTWYETQASKKGKSQFTPIEVDGQKMYRWEVVGQTQEEKELEWKLMQYSMKVEERDWKIYCRIFEKYFNKWWD